MTEDLASTIDHTLLKANATAGQIEKLCAEAAEHRFKAVCVNRFWVESAWRLLKDTGVEICTVVGFPLGACTGPVKSFEASSAASAGASEIDMVLNIGAMLDARHDVVRQDIADVVTGASGRLVKVIIETCYLDDEQKRIACELSAEAGADFVKTSTGFGTGGATVADVALMRKSVGEALGVKASGGIKTREDALAMIGAGASRIGTSSGIAIVTG